MTDTQTQVVPHGAGWARPQVEGAPQSTDEAHSDNRQRDGPAANSGTMSGPSLSASQVAASEHPVGTPIQPSLGGGGGGGGGPSPPSSEPDRLPKDGDVVAGRYVVLHHIRKGGQGRVFQALDLKIEREVALKFLIVNPDGEPAWNQRHRFAGEAHIQGILQHQHIVALYDYVTDDPAGPFLVMEYVEGQSLDNWLLGGPRSDQEIAAVMLQLCSAASFMHSRNIWFRDFKLANVMITPTGQVKICDFGISRMAGRSSFTMVNTIVGTPDNLAPEQLEPGPRPDGKLTDMFHLGLLNYRMLADGQKAFNHARPPEQMCFRTPDNPAIHSSVPRNPGLCAAALHAIELNPEARCQTPKALADEIVAAMAPASAWVPDASMHQQVPTPTPDEGVAVPGIEPGSDVEAEGPAPVSRRVKNILAMAALTASTSLGGYFWGSTGNFARTEGEAVEAGPEQPIAMDWVGRAACWQLRGGAPVVHMPAHAHLKGHQLTFTVNDPRVPGRITAQVDGSQFRGNGVATIPGEQSLILISANGAIDLMDLPHGIQLWARWIKAGDAEPMYQCVFHAETS